MKDALGIEVSVRTLQRWASAGALSVFRVAGRTYFRTADLERYIKSQEHAETIETDDVVVSLVSAVRRKARASGQG